MSAAEGIESKFADPTSIKRSEVSRSPNHLPEGHSNRPFCRETVGRWRPGRHSLLLPCLDVACRRADPSSLALDAIEVARHDTRGKERFPREGSCLRGARPRYQGDGRRGRIRTHERRYRAPCSGARNSWSTIHGRSARENGKRDGDLL